MRDEETRTRPEASDDGCGTCTTVDRSWPSHLQVGQVRIARPTDRLDEVVAFYRDGIGLAEIGSFRGHAGYDGVMLGLPGAEYHLEFTRREHGSPGTAPSKDNLLVLYLPQPGAVEAVTARLRGGGHALVEPENPYWAAISVTVEDPDGWRVVLVRAAGFMDARPQAAEGAHDVR
jgi:catechol 2,3-dioxygenase-like lactoylglutathione lyase family enzyme